MTNAIWPSGISIGPSPLARDGDRPAEHGSGGGSAHRHHQLRPQTDQLDIEPEAACLDLRRLGRLVDATLAAGFKLEVLHRIGDVDCPPVDAGLLHRAIHDLAGRPNERTADHVLLVAWLLANKDNARMRRTFAEHCLGCWPEKVAAAAIGRFMHRLLQRCIGMQRQHNRTERRAIRRPWRLVKLVRLRDRRADATMAQQTRVMCLPPCLERNVIRNSLVRRSGREAKLGAIPMRAAVRSDNGERQVGEPPRDQLRIRLQHVMCGRVPAEVAGVAVLGQRKVAQQRAHPVRLGADREGETLGAPQLRIVGLRQHALAGIGAPDQSVQQIESFGLTCLDRQ